jgi:hypothetical protein
MKWKRGGMVLGGGGGRNGEVDELEYMGNKGDDVYYLVLYFDKSSEKTYDYALRYANNPSENVQSIHHTLYHVTRYASTPLEPHITWT